MGQNSTIPLSLQASTGILAIFDLAATLWGIEVMGPLLAYGWMLATLAFAVACFCVPVMAELEVFGKPDFWFSPKFRSGWRHRYRQLWSKQLVAYLDPDGDSDMNRAIALTSSLVLVVAASLIAFPGLLTDAIGAMLLPTSHRLRLVLWFRAHWPEKFSKQEQ